MKLTAMHYPASSPPIHTFAFSFHLHSSSLTRCHLSSCCHPVSIQFHSFISFNPHVRYCVMCLVRVAEVISQLSGLKYVLFIFHHVPVTSARSQARVYAQRKTGP